MKDPAQLQRKRNLHEPDMTCRDYLTYTIATHPTFEEAAWFLGVTYQTLIRWRRLYGMEVGQKTTEAPEGA